MGLTTEILLFEASEGFHNDPGIVIPAFQIVLKAEGVHAPGYYGTQIEASTWGNLFLNWDSFEHHKAVIDGPDYPTLLEKLGPALRAGGKTEMHHVEFSAPTIALEKPVTEVLVLTLKAPENRKAVEEILGKFSEASEKIIVFGKTLEDANKYVLIGGWPTVEAHKETAAKPEVAAALEKLYSLANKDHLYHTKLSQFRL